MTKPRKLTPEQEMAHHLEAIARDCRDGGPFAIAEARRMLASKVLLAALEGIAADAEQEILDWCADVQEGGSPPKAAADKWHAVIVAIAKAAGDKS